MEKKKLKAKENEINEKAMKKNKMEAKIKTEIK